MSSIKRRLTPPAVYESESETGSESESGSESETGSESESGSESEDTSASDSDYDQMYDLDYDSSSEDEEYVKIPEVDPNYKKYLDSIVNNR